MSKPILIMMCGIPASGKSSYANKLAKKYNANIYASDVFRDKMFGKIYDRSNNEVIFAELHKWLLGDLSNGNNVIYDACNINKKLRTDFLNQIKDKIDCTRSIYIMNTPYKKCIENNMGKNTPVPEKVMARMYRYFDAPSYDEGWDNIYICKEFLGITITSRLDKE